MLKVIGTILSIFLYLMPSHAQNNFDIRFELDNVNCTAQTVCYRVALRPSNGSFGLAGQKYRLFYDASELTYTSGTSLLSGAYTPFTLVQNVVVDATGTGSLPFEANLGFLNFGMDLNDVVTGGISLPAATWTPTANLCFDILLDPIGDANTCVDIVWARDGVTSEYASAFVEVSEWVGPNITTAAVGLFYDDLDSSDGNTACYQLDCIGIEDTFPLCTDGIDNDGDGLIDCLDPDCVAIPTLDCDGDGIPNGDDCAPTDPIIYPGAMCNDNNDNTSNDRYNDQCQCIGLPTVPGEYDIRFLFKDYNCVTNNFTYFVQLRNITGAPFNLAGQNYRMYYNGALMTYVSGISTLPPADYSPYTLVQNLENQNADTINGALFFEGNLSFLNYFMDLDDTLGGGIFLPTDSTWVTTSELTFNSTNSLTGTNIPLIDIIWARQGLTAEYATAFVEVAGWQGIDSTTAAIPNLYFDVTQLDTTNIGFITDCDGDDVPNDDDCAPADPLVFSGAVCNDNNPNTFNDRYNDLCVCVGTPIVAGADYDIRLEYKDFNCIDNSFCYSVALRSTSGLPVNLAGQNYRLYFDGLKMTYLSGTSLLPQPQYTDFNLIQFIDNQNAGAINGPLSFEDNLSFLNYSMDLNDIVNGGIILPANGAWVTTSELCFRSYAPLSGINIPCIEIVWARDSLTDVYASAFVEVSKWVGPGNTVSAIANQYGDVALSDLTNICFITDCDGDDVPNDDDCAPTNPLIFAGAICDDNNINTINDRYDSLCVCVGIPITPGFGSISGLTWHDFNGNGTRDLADVGIPGVMVRLFTNGGVPVSSVFTSITGAYSFTNLPSGSYYVVFDRPNIFQYTFANRGSDLTDSDVTGANGIGSTDFIVLVGNQSVNNTDAGFYLCAKIGDNVWYDINRNDIYDSSENGINGIRVNLWRNHFGTWIIWDFAITGVKPGSPSLDGYFEFCAPPGQYYIQVIMHQLGLVQALPDRGNNEQNDSDINNANGPGTSSSFTMTSGQVKDDLGAGFYPMAVAGNLVWDDQNQNGVQDDGEPTVSGVMVEAIDVETHETIGSSTTGTDGTYEIDYLPKKEVYFRFTPPTGYTATVARATTDDVDSDVDHSFGPFTTRAIMMQPAQVNEHIDLGISQGALPLEWQDVRVYNKGDHHIIHWQTLREVNVSHFVVERMLEGSANFEALPEIVSAYRSGSAAHRYDMIDKEVSSHGLYIYRVKQIDFDGKLSYSPYVTIRRSQSRQIELYPNPTRNQSMVQINLEQEAAVRITIYDVHGRLVKVVCDQKIPAGTNDVHVDVSDMAAGPYTIKVDIDGDVNHKKMTVIK